ncbi:MAG: efflux RND transporter periplasmic adaptor subunit [Melioribacteraceae bacterium]|nr:efflux RND transporter periplasmic adaptor subunit [Melioribacteraceae bacterium]
MNKKLIRNISIGLVVLIILLLIIIPKLKSKEEKSGGIRSAVIAAQVKIIKPKNFENNLSVSGSIISNEEVELHTETSGKVIGIFFKEGSYVKKGDILVKINDADLQAQLKKAEVKLKDAEEKEFRQKRLFEKNGISKETYEEAINNLNSAIADVENIKALIAKTEIKAPFDGKIGLRYVTEGAYVNPTTQIAKLQNVNPVKIDFAIPQRFANEISVGNTIQIQTPNGKKFNAKIYAIESKINPDTRSLQARAICNNDKGELIPGSFVTILVNLNEIKNALTIPTQALTLDITGERVFVYKNGFAIPKKVESGIRTETEVQITDGLKIGDTVLVSGIMQLRPRAKIKITSIVD